MQRGEGAGVTMVHDMGPFPVNEDKAWENLEHVYIDAANVHQLPLRVLAFVPLSSRWGCGVCCDDRWFCVWLWPRAGIQRELLDAVRCEQMCSGGSGRVWACAYALMRACTCATACCRVLLVWRAQIILFSKQQSSASHTRSQCWCVRGLQHHITFSNICPLLMRHILTYPACPLHRKRLRDYVRMHGKRHASGRVFWGSLKEFSDGSLGSSTALMHEPYTNDPSTRGLAVIDFDDLGSAIADANAACLQVDWISRVNECLARGWTGREGGCWGDRTESDMAMCTADMQALSNCIHACVCRYVHAHALRSFDT